MNPNEDNSFPFYQESNFLDFQEMILQSTLEYRRLHSTSENNNHYHQLFNLINQSRTRNEDRSQPKENLEKFRKLNNRKKIENVFDNSKSYIKLTIAKNSNPSISQNTTVHYINEFGLIGTAKNTTSDDIIFGRQHRSQNGIIPNDVMLVGEERIISRIHCRMVCASFFKEIQDIDIVYRNTIQRLPFPINIKTILVKFLEQPRDIYIQDLGSTIGTLIKVNRLIPRILEKRQLFSIGSDTTFIIEEIHRGKLTGLETDCYFKKCLKMLTKKTIKIFGISEDRFKDVALLDEDEMSYLDIIRMLLNFKYPFVFIRFVGEGVEQPLALFFSQTPINREYFIGRGQDNHIKINSTTISRKQTRLSFQVKTKQWIINDGSKERESANGTWLSCQNSEQKQLKCESDLIPLINNTEIKISDYLIKVESEFNQFKRLKETELWSVIL